MAHVLLLDANLGAAALMARRFSDDEVTTAASVAEVLSLLQSGVRFDVIFARMVLPDESGTDLRAQVSALDFDQARRVVLLPAEGAAAPSSTAELRAIIDGFLPIRPHKMPFGSDVPENSDPAMDGRREP